jgi:hypothetical protein
MAKGGNAVARIDGADPDHAKERVALKHTERMTTSDQNVDDGLFSRLHRFFDEYASVKLTTPAPGEIFEQVQPGHAHTVAAPV